MNYNLEAKNTIMSNTVASVSNAKSFSQAMGFTEPTDVFAGAIQDEKRRAPFFVHAYMALENDGIVVMYTAPKKFIGTNGFIYAQDVLNVKIIEKRLHTIVHILTSNHLWVITLNRWAAFLFSDTKKQAYHRIIRKLFNYMDFRKKHPERVNSLYIDGDCFHPQNDFEKVDTPQTLNLFMAKHSIPKDSHALLVEATPEYLSTDANKHYRAGILRYFGDITLDSLCFFEPDKLHLVHLTKDHTGKLRGSDLTCDVPYSQVDFSMNSIDNHDVISNREISNDNNQILVIHTSSVVLYMRTWRHVTNRWLPKLQEKNLTYFAHFSQNSGSTATDKQICKKYFQYASNVLPRK